ncbi:MAG: DUF1501 domain-containing protein [Ardenticatenaceae bacterium]|nr:DUF1501 domain-containing protein [Ardenticatenaceae bacterium]
MNSTLTRRDFFRSLAAAPAATPWPTWMPRLAFAPQQTAPRGDVLVVVFLRGAADVLNMVVPFGEEAYYQARPTLGIPQPDFIAAGTGMQAVDLDGFFGFHPSLGPLKAAFDEQHLGIIHACGAPDISRSHFKAMALMERGVEDERGPASGWINRHLATYNTGNNSPIRAIGLGSVLPQSLYGEVPATAMRSIVDFHLNGDDRVGQQLYRMLRGLYSQDSEIGRVGRETLDVIDILSKLDPAQYRPEDGATYPESTFGYNLRQAAMLIKAEAGLEVAAIDLGGWDTHFGQGGSQGLMASLLSDLGQGLAAFHADMIDYMNQVTVVVMSEFGRRVKENASLGTDHGHGSMMMLMGGHVNGGQVIGEWPGLEIDQLFGPGDLAVTTDYRDVLAEVVGQRLNNGAMDQIFPDYVPRPVGAIK